MSQHHRIWLSAHPDFELVIDDSRPILWQEDNVDGAAVVRANFRTINKGTFTGDLPNGRKGTGKRFVFVGIIDMVIEKTSGLIVQLDEWYTNNAFDSRGEGGLGEYHWAADRGVERATRTRL